MVSFNPSTCVTFNNISRDLSPHSSPLETLPQILVHLICSWMDRIPGALCFAKYLATELKIFRNH
jgi:hypothetical protein